MSRVVEAHIVGTFRHWNISSTILSSLEERILNGSLFADNENVPHNFTIHGNFFLEELGYVNCSFHFLRSVNRILDVVPGNCDSIANIERREAFENLPLCYFQFSTGDNVLHSNMMARNLCPIHDRFEDWEDLLRTVVLYCNGGALKKFIVCNDEEWYTLPYYKYRVRKRDFLQRCLLVCSRHFLYFNVDATTMRYIAPNTILLQGDISTSIGNHSLTLLINEYGFLRCNNVPVGYIGDIPRPHSSGEMEA